MVGDFVSQRALMQVCPSTMLLIFLKFLGTKVICSFPLIVQLGHSIGCFLNGEKSRERGKHTESKTQRKTA